MRPGYFAAMGCWMAVISTLVLQAQETPAEPKGVAVSGTVIHSLTREPVRRAEVTLMPAPEGAWQSRGGSGAAGLLVAPGAQLPAGGPAQSPPRSTLTGADGAFRFENVAEGTYTVLVRREGMVSGRPGLGLSPQRIRVRAGAPMTGLRYALTPQAVITGRVLDDEGEPVQGAQAMALRRAAGLTGTSYMPSGPAAPTDDRGRYRLHNLPPGRYLVYAFGFTRTLAGEGQERATYVPVFYPDALTPLEAGWVRVEPGQELSDVDLRLRRAPARRISGRVLLEDGSPARQFMVSTFNSNAGFSVMSGRMRYGREPGSFILEEMTPGSHVLTARLMDASGPMMQRGAIAHVEVGDRDVEGVEIRIQPQFSLRGEVRLDGPGAESLKPLLSKLRIFLAPSGAGFGIGFGQADVEEDATFDVPVSSPGRYRVHLSGEAMQQAYVGSIRTSGGADAARELDLTAGAPESIVITLRTDAARIAARRQRAEKEEEACNPYFAALIEAAPEDRMKRQPIMAPVDNAGQAVLFPVPPGEYLIFGACAPDTAFIHDPDLLDSLVEKAEKIRVQAGEQRTVTLKDATPQ